MTSDPTVPNTATSGAALLLMASAIWGTAGTAQELLDVDATAAQIGAGRLVVGAAALLAFALATGRRAALFGSWRGGRHRWVIAAGAATAVYQAAFFSAVDNVGVALAAVITLGSAPAFCGLLGRSLLGEELPPRWVAATGCAVAGCAVLLLPGAHTTASVRGVALGLLAGGCYGLYTTCAKRLLDDGTDVVSVLASTIGVGAVFSAPAFVSGIDALRTPTGLLLQGWLGLVATASAYILFARGLGRTSAATAGTLSLAEPLTASFLGVVVLGETLGAASVAGALLLALGLAVMALSTRSATNATRHSSRATALA